MDTHKGITNTMVVASWNAQGIGRTKWEKVAGMADVVVIQVESEVDTL